MNFVTIPLAEAKNKLSELVARVNHGEEIMITRHDKEVARLVPATKRSKADGLRAINIMRELRKNTFLNQPGKKKKLASRDLIAAGRRH